MICPVPLDQWTADMGGRNITIHIAVQSWAQLKQKYGDAGAASIINNTATLLVYGGTRDPDDLAAYVTLVGERDEDVRTWDHEQRVATTTTRRVPVLTAAQIAQLPFRKVVIIRRGMPAAVGRVQMAWKRRDVRRHARAVRWAERIERWTARGEAIAAWLDPKIAAANAWLDRQAAQPDVLASLSGWWRARRATRRAQSALDARGSTRAIQDTVQDAVRGAGDPGDEGSRS